MKIQVLGGKGGTCEAGSPLASVRVDAPRIAPRASMDSDGFSIQLCPKKDSLVSTMGNYSTTLHIKRISGEFFCVFCNENVRYV